MAANIEQAKKWVERSKPSIFDRLNIVNPNHSEMNYIKGKLQKHRLNKKLAHPEIADNFGEVWQYIHTVECKYFFFWKRECHVLRHRLHPSTNKEEVLLIPTSRSFRGSEGIFGLCDN